MKKKINFQKIGVVSLFIAFIYLIHKYQDTAAFQGAMRLIFNPGESLAPPAFWLEYRSVILAGLTIALVLYYLPVWRGFRETVRIYRDSMTTAEKPTASALEAGFLYQRNWAGCLAIWLLEMCRLGVLSLHYRKGARPWSVAKGRGWDEHQPDNEIAGDLFKDEDSIPLRAVVSDPHPRIRAASLKILKKADSEYGSRLRPRRTIIPALVLFILLMAEIPFYVAGQSDEIPMLIVVVLFSALFSAFPTFAFCFAFPMFYNGPALVGWIAFGGATVITLFGYSILFFDGYLDAHWGAAVCPALAIVIAVLVYNAPRPPKDASLLGRIVGYKKYLGSGGRLVQEDDLAWTIGLGVHTDIIDHSFHYQEGSTPDWLLVDESDRTGVQEVMRLLHQTFPRHVEEAVYGELKSKSRIRRTGSMTRY